MGNTGCSYQGTTQLVSGLSTIDGFCYLRNFCHDYLYYSEEHEPTIDIHEPAQYNDNPCIGTLACSIDAVQENSIAIEGALDETAEEEFLGYTSDGLCAYEVGCKFTLSGLGIPFELWYGNTVSVRTIQYREGECGQNDPTGGPTVDPPDPCDLPWDILAGEEEDDWDEDGIVNRCDNCPEVPNFYQEDNDNDGVGNACDYCPHRAMLPEEDPMDETGENDPDGDQIPENCDNCAEFRYPVGWIYSWYNPAQCDIDEDGAGDFCDPCQICGDLTSPFECYEDQGCVLNAQGGCDIIPLVGSRRTTLTPLYPLEVNEDTASTDDKTIDEIIAASNFEVVNAYPNPFNRQVNIAYINPLSQGLTVQVVSPLGQIIAAEQIVLPQGASYFTLDFAKYGLPSGNYLLRFLTENGELAFWKLVYLSDGE